MSFSLLFSELGPPLKIEKQKKDKKNFQCTLPPPPHQNKILTPPPKISQPSRKFLTLPPKISHPPPKKISQPPLKYHNPTRENLNQKNMLTINPPPPLILFIFLFFLPLFLHFSKKI